MALRFEIEYMPGLENNAADALSRREETVSVRAISLPIWLEWEPILLEAESDPELR